MYDVGIRRHRQTVAIRGQIRQTEACLILHPRKRFIVEGRDEDVVDKVAHGFAAATMCHRDFGHMNASQAAFDLGRCGCELDDVHDLVPATLGSASLISARLEWIFSTSPNW